MTQPKTYQTAAAAEAAIRNYYDAEPGEWKEVAPGVWILRWVIAFGAAEYAVAAHIEFGPHPH